MKYATSAIAAGLLVFGATASAQYRPRDDQRDEQRERVRDRVFEHLRTDLERIDTVPLPFTGDHARIMKAREEVNQLERKVAGGATDVRDFDTAIAAVQSVMDGNHLLTDSNRDYLANDLGQLREYRERVQSDFER